MALKDAMLENVVKAAEVGGVAAAFGYLHGREGTMPTVLGLDADVFAALALHGVGFLGGSYLGTKVSTHAHNLGNGALAYLLGYKGAKMGQEDFKTKGTLFGKTKGQPGVRSLPEGYKGTQVTLGQPWDYSMGAGPARPVAKAYGY